MKEQVEEIDFKKASRILFVLAGIAFLVTITFYVLLHKEIIENTSFLKDYVTYLAITCLLTLIAVLTKKM